jgi:nucleotide-binding universal stress UspA family protein
VVGVDGSKGAIAAALWAVDDALAREIPLRLLYAIEPDDAAQTLPSVAARKLAVAENAVRHASAAIEATGKWVKVEVEIVQERPITALIRASRSAALVCVGAVGVHHFRPDRAGSTASALAASAHAPVAIVRGDSDLAARQVGWVVADVQASADSSVVLDAAFHEARLRNAPLRAVTGRQRGRDDDAAAEADRRILADLDRRLARFKRTHPGIRVESVAANGSLLDYLAANSGSVRLAVVGAGDPERLAELLGPSGNAVLQVASCTVLVVDHQHL